MGISVGDQIPDSRRRRGGAWHQRRSMGAVRRSGNQPDANLANSAVNLCNCSGPQPCLLPRHLSPTGTHGAPPLGRGRESLACLFVGPTLPTLGSPDCLVIMVYNPYSSLLRYAKDSPRQRRQVLILVEIRHGVSARESRVDAEGPRSRDALSPRGRGGLRHACAAASSAKMGGIR